MALSNNFIPNTSLVFNTRDFSRDLRQSQAEEKAALQGLAKFLGQMHDYAQSNKQANLMEEDNKNRKALEDQIAVDKERLELLKRDLATLQGGV